MSVPNNVSQISLRHFAEQFRAEMVPMGSRFSYFAAAVPLSGEELREYLDEPVAALPPALAAQLPRILLFLVPYLAKVPAPPRSRRAPELLISLEPPGEDLSGPSASSTLGRDAVLAFAVKDVEVADYHYQFFHALATLIAALPAGIPRGYTDLLHEEIKQGAHGEVDEASWTLKQALHSSPRRFPAYARQSFIDTLTLYLHGICCDIDVETGPRQLASNLLRKRLRYFKQLYPPPSGYAVLPEDLR